MLRRAELARAADGAVAALVALLKRPAVDTLNGPLRIVAVQARHQAQSGWHKEHNCSRVTQPQ